jgi:hypothetical protein
MTGRILDHGPVAIPIRATTGQECSYPRTIGFSCVAPAEHPVPGHSFGTLRMAEMLGSEVVVGPVPNRALCGKPCTAPRRAAETLTVHRAKNPC